jgi:NAD-dependent deacetylase sirtuin 4
LYCHSHLQSGLNDYRGPAGTYILNRAYRPIYYSEFLIQHPSRQRYWARSFVGWASTANAAPNVTHRAIKRLGELNLVQQVITQNVDSFHSITHPNLSTIELHGHLRSVVCTACGTHLPRQEFQSWLLKLNPRWAELVEVIQSATKEEQAAKGIRPNPDGDIDLPGAPYSTFSYPPCPTCLEKTPEGYEPVVVDSAGAWKLPEKTVKPTAGVLKPAVVMFGEGIPPNVRFAADEAVAQADTMLVVGSSLATYSAFKLAKTIKEQGKSLGVLNLGGVRGEAEFFPDETNSVRVAWDAGEVLQGVVDLIDK